MKKILCLLVLLGYVGAANAVQKCIALGSSSGCDDYGATDNLTGLNNGYGVEWYGSGCGDGNDIEIRGLAICANTTGTAGDTAETLFIIDPDEGENGNCWCKMVSPAVSAWVLEGTYSTTEYCSSDCTDFCSRIIPEYSGSAARDSMLNSLSN